MQMQSASVTRAPFEQLIARVREIGQSVIAPAAVDVDRVARFPIEAIDALRDERLLGGYVPMEFGGLGLSVIEIARLCETIGHSCASTAMVYAMHQIQVACIVHHGRTKTWFQHYLGELARRQLLLASATTEEGVGGDLRSSLCAVHVEAGYFTLEKKAPVISYGLESDAILATCRRSSDAGPGDQSLVLLRREDAELEAMVGWDTMGFRGTRSFGFTLRSRGEAEQIFPEPFAEILARTMHPFSHMMWGSVWLGLAQDAVDRARAIVRRTTRGQSGAVEVSRLRLGEIGELLFQMRSGLYRTLWEYQCLLDVGDLDAFKDYGFAIRVNNVKISCSELVVRIVGLALQIVGISGYRNDSPNSLCRHLRDAYGAALMINNDRLRAYNSALHMMHSHSGG